MDKYGIEVLSAETAFNIGRIIGSAKNIKIGAACDGEEISKIIKNALTLGIIASSGTVYDYGEVSMPLLSAGARFMKNICSVYVYEDEEKSGVRLVLLDEYGIEINEYLKNRLLNHPKSTTNLYVKKMGEVVDMSHFKMYYTKYIINSVKSQSFNINFSLSTKLHSLSEVLKDVLSEFYEKMDLGCIKKYAFSADITNMGDKIILKLPTGTEVDEYTFFMLMVYILLRDTNERTFVLPSSCDKSLKDAVLKLGGRVIKGGDTKRERMRKMVEYGSTKQMMMECDGVYAAFVILDFLNRYELSLIELLKKLPTIFSSEDEIKTESDENERILNEIKSEYNAKGSTKSGIRIETNDAATIVIPRHGSVIRIISDAESMEAANEISTLFKNKIKMLAKGESV